MAKIESETNQKYSDLDETGVNQMSIKKLLAASVLTAGAFTTTANAGDRSGQDYPGTDVHPHYYTSAKVVDVRPMYRWISVNRPSTKCHYEQVHTETTHRKSSTGATILGGVIGGALGRRLGGKHRGRRHGSTAAGVILGASIARGIHRNNNPGHTHNDVHTRRVCRTQNNHHQERVFKGYYVTYRLRGREYAVRTQRSPGRFIRLRVTATPVL